jgi:hypothetical protein
VISLERFKGKLLLRLDASLPELVYFSGENSLGRGGRVNAVSLNGDEDTAANLEEVLGVENDDTGLIGLGNISEDAVDHADEHAVFQWMTGVLWENC